MPENVTSAVDKWKEIDLYPKVKIDYWNADKGFGFCSVGGQKYYLDTSDVYPALDKGNPQTDSEYELHLVSVKRPRKSGQNPSATCVWGNPESTSVVVPIKSGNGKGLNLAYLNKDGTLSVSMNIELPVGLDLESLEAGAGYEVGVFKGTRMYSSISILGSKKMSIEDVQREKESKKYIPMINAYNNWVSRNVDFETGRCVNTEGVLPEGSELKYQAGWQVRLEDIDRGAIIDWFHNRLIIRPVTKRVAERWSESSVDDFGDVGQAVGGGTRLIGTTSTRETVIKPSREFDLPKEIAKVLDNNRFDNVPLDKILAVKYLDDRKKSIPISCVATNRDGDKVAFWSKRYECWRKFTDETRKYLDFVKEYDDGHYTANIKHNDPWVSNFFSMITMAKLQDMNVGNIAPWLEKTN